MEKEKCLTVTYKDDDITVVIDKLYYMPTIVHIHREPANGGTKSLSLTQAQALKLLTILSTANEEAEI